MDNWAVGLLGGVSGAANAVSEMAEERKRKLAEDLSMKAKEQMQIRAENRAMTAEKGLLEDERAYQGKTAETKRSQDLADQKTGQKYALERIEAQKTDKQETPKNTKESYEFNKQRSAELLNVALVDANLPVQVMEDGTMSLKGDTKGLTKEQQQTLTSVAGKLGFTVAYGGEKDGAPWWKFWSNEPVSSEITSAYTGDSTLTSSGGNGNITTNQTGQKPPQQAKDMSTKLQELLQRSKTKPQERGLLVPDKFDSSLDKYYNEPIPAQRKNQDFMNRVSVR